MSRERTVCIICGFEQPPIPGIKDGPAVPGICYDCCNAVNYLREHLREIKKIVEEGLPKVTMAAPRIDHAIWNGPDKTEE